MKPARLPLLLTIATFSGIAAAGTAAGDQRPNGRSGEPKITHVSPSTAAPNETVSIRGTNLLPNPRILVGGQEIKPAKSGEKQLSVRLPPGLGGGSCEARVGLAVRTNRGTSTPAFLLVRERDPRLDHCGDKVLTGRALRLKGSGFAGATFTLGDATLIVRASTDTEATVMIPKDHPLGRSVLAVANQCDRDEIDVQVKTAPPQIVSVDPPKSVAPTGILEITTDVTDPSLITSAQLGSFTFPATDPSLFRIVPSQDALANVVVALRIPADTNLGRTKLRLTGPAGTGDRALVEVAVPKEPTPPPARDTCGPPTPTSVSKAYAFFSVPIRYPSLRAGDDETIPLGSSNDGGPLQLSCQHLSHDDGIYSEWFYDLRIERTPACGLSGTITGWEMYCPRKEGCVPTGHYAPMRRHCRPETVSDYVPQNLKCFPLTATYRLNSTDNTIRLTVDRGDGPEEYVGGWGLGEELNPPQANDEYSHPRFGYLLLRSKRTGLQMTLLANLLRLQCTP